VRFGGEGDKRRHPKHNGVDRGIGPNGPTGIGRFQTTNILLVLAPSGLWMAYYASSGPIAGAAFAILAVLTGACAAFGWRSAVKRRFAEHRRWMWRCFLLLCSAVVIRLIGGLATVMGVETPWFNPLASWVSWLVPLSVFELSGFCVRRLVPSPAQSTPASHSR